MADVKIRAELDGPVVRVKVTATAPMGDQTCTWSDDITDALPAELHKSLTECLSVILEGVRYQAYDNAKQSAVVHMAALINAGTLGNSGHHGKTAGIARLKFAGDLSAQGNKVG